MSVLDNNIKMVSKKPFSVLNLFLYYNTCREKFLKKIMRLFCMNILNILTNFSIGTSRGRIQIHDFPSSVSLNFSKLLKS